MTTRAEIEDALRKYGKMPERQLPARLKRPKSEHEFALSFAIHTQGQDVEPVYDENDKLLGWSGIELKE